MSKLTTDDEVLALAEKIQQQRYVNTVYAKAYEQVSYINKRCHDGISGLRITCIAEADHGGIGHHEIKLPNEMANDLIQFLQDYIAEDVKED